MPKFKALAKLNLYLNVLKREEDLHKLEGIFIKVPFLFDEIEMVKRKDFVNTVTYHDNRKYKCDNVLKMANLLVDTYKINGCDFYIKKNIPEMCGLGGSSSDAAGVAYLMEEMFLDNKIPNDILLKVGSDVPFCKESNKAIVSGFGEIIENIDFPDFDLTILDIKTKSNTKDVYNLFDKVGGEEVDINQAYQNLKNGQIPEFKNSLTKAASLLNSKIGDTLDILKASNINAGMTGSGSAVFFTGNYDSNLLKKIGEYKIYKRGASNLDAE